MKKKKELQPCPRSEHAPRTLYAKVNNKYEPVAEYWTHDYMADGNYLVRIKPGLTSIMTYLGRPDAAKVELALQEFKDGMINAIMDANCPKAKLSASPKINMAIWKAYKKVLGKKEEGRLYYDSLNNVIDAGIKYLRDRIT